jgi:hypothetical protein
VSDCHKTSTLPPRILKRKLPLAPTAVSLSAWLPPLVILATTAAVLLPRNPGGRTGWAAQLIFIVLVSFLVFRLSRLDLLGNSVLWTVVGLQLLIIAIGAVRHVSSGWLLPASKRVLIFSFALSLIPLMAILVISSGAPVEGARVAHPLQNARWYVVQGGANSGINHHHRVPAQRYAIDMTVLGAEGRRADGLYPTDLSSYFAYGRTVTAPCDGVVVSLNTSSAEQRIGTTDVENPAGNYVAIACSGYTIVIAHLQPGSIALRLNDPIQAGATLGRIGNSGNTSEPHLHVHAVAGIERSTERLLFTGVGVPLFLDGEFLVRGQTNIEPL